MVKTKERKPPRGTGPYGNGAAPLETDSLTAAGLTLVVGLTAAGKHESHTVIPTDEVPPSWLSAPPRPTTAHLTCKQDAWRLDRGTGTSWVCSRCHP
jgi:hypothetical protein